MGTKRSLKNSCLYYISYTSYLAKNIKADKEKKMTGSNLYQVSLCSCLCSYWVSTVQTGIYLVAVVLMHTQKTIQRIEVTH